MRGWGYYSDESDESFEHFYDLVHTLDSKGIEKKMNDIIVYEHDKDPKVFYERIENFLSDEKIHKQSVVGVCLSLVKVLSPSGKSTNKEFTFPVDLPKDFPDSLKEKLVFILKGLIVDESHSQARLKTLNHELFLFSEGKQGTRL